MDLGHFLSAQGTRRRIAGEHDCCTFPASWSIANGWADPMAAWRGAYSTEDEAAEFISAAGGLAELFAIGMAAAGIPRGDSEFLPGDIGVIRIGDHEAGGIFAGKRWAFVADRGLGLASVDASAIVATWRVCHG